MAHFAQLDSDNNVLQVIVIDNAQIDNGDGTENEQAGINFITNILQLPDTWLQTSFNNNIRGQYAKVGGYYNAEEDKFYPRSKPSVVTTDDSPAEFVDYDVVWDTSHIYFGDWFPVDSEGNHLTIPSHETGSYLWEETTGSWILRLPISEVLGEGTTP